MVLVTKYTSQNEVDIPNTNKSALFVDCSGKLKIMDSTGTVREISCGYTHCANPYVEILVVGGGGKGSSSSSAMCVGSGGGGGGVYYNPRYELCEDNYCIYVGRGGCVILDYQGQSGESTIFGPGIARCAYILAGGGQGGYSICANSCRKGGNGGCVALNASSDGSTCYTPVYYYGGQGGASPSNNYAGGQGGGGAFGNAETIIDCCCNRWGGRGGDGYASEISGTLEYYGGGGGGAAYSFGLPARLGGEGGVGGGHGYDCNHIDLEPTGYGGGGGGGNIRSSCNSGNGYNGVVYIRYKTDGSNGITCATGGTVYCCNGYTIHRFNYISMCCQPFDIICKAPIYYN